MNFKNMKQYRYILLFIIVVSVSFVPFIGIYCIITGREDYLLKNIVINLPVCLMIGSFDYLFIRLMSGVSSLGNSLRLTADIVVTTVACVFIVCFLNFIFSDFGVRELVKSALPAVPWNWVVTLLIELFFYNNRQQEIEKEKANYQLAALRNQINPHFLFNSLNVLASLAYIDAEKTNIFAKRLSAVYRYLLSNGERTTVSIDEELEFAHKYIYLEQVRFGDSLKVEMTDGRVEKGGRIIPASVQMLVENAIKHNVCTSESPLVINIVVTDDKVTVTNNLRLRRKVAASGVGLKNIRRQYALHNQAISLEFTDKTFTVTLPVMV